MHPADEIQTYSTCTDAKPIVHMAVIKSTYDFSFVQQEFLDQQGLASRGGSGRVHVHV